MGSRAAWIWACALVMAAGLWLGAAASGAPHRAGAPHGLRGAYAPRAGAAVSFARTDARPDFDWRRTPARRGFPRSGFTVRWSGTLTVPRGGRWRLELRVRGSARLTVGTLSADVNSRLHAGAPVLTAAATRPASLAAGRRLPLTITYRAGGRSGGSIELDWVRGPGRWVAVPSGALTPPPAVAAPVTPAPSTTVAAPVTVTRPAPTVSVAAQTTPVPPAPTTTTTATTPVQSTTTATTPAPVVHPPFGGNVNGNADYSPDFMFVDAMLSAGSFYAVTSDGTAPDLGTPATVDADGWPTQDFAFYVNETAPQPGTYTVTGTDTAGEPTVAMHLTQGSVGAMSYDAGTGAFSVPVTVSAANDDPGATDPFILVFTHTGGGVRALHVIRPGYDASHPPVYTTSFLDEIEANDPSVLRAMDLAATNANVVSSWADRTQPGQPQDGLETATVPWSDSSTPTITTPKGIAWEYIVDLANATHTSLWVNVPVLADDDYVTQLATLLKRDLDPGLSVYVEYSNELWNYGFDQSHINAGLAQQAYDNGDTTLAYDGDTNIYTMANRRQAERTVQISELFKAVWGADDGRVHTVLANQYVNPWNVADQLSYIAAEIGPPREYLTDIAAAPYVAVPNDPNLSESDVLADLSTAIDAEQASGTIEDWRTEAGANGLGLDAYEGGFDTYGDQSIDAKAAAMHNPQITALVERYLTNWYQDGGGLFNWYTLGTGTFETQYGDWSITDDQSDLTQPKELGVQAIASGSVIAPTAGTLLPAQLDARDHSLARGIPVDPMVRYIGAGARFDYLVRAPSAGTYPLSVLTDDGPAPLDVSVDGTAAGTIEASEPTPGQDVGESTSLALQLNAGLHVISLTVPDNRPFDLDSLLIRQDGGPGLGALLPRMNDFAFYQDQTLAAGQSFSNSFTVADSATPAADLTVTASSDNPAVVADDDITLTRAPGGEVDFTVTATPGNAGTANIVFTVTDAAGLRRQTEIVVTVQ